MGKGGWKYALDPAEGRETGLTRSADMATCRTETLVRALDAGLRGGSLLERHYETKQIFSDRRRTRFVSGLWPGDDEGRTHADILKSGRE